MSHHLEEEDHDNDDIERELYQLGLSDVPPPPPPALRGAVPWPPPSARSLSAPAIQEDSLQDPSVPPHSPRPPPGGYRDPAQHGFGPAHLLLHHHHHQILQQHHQQPPPHHLHHHHHHLQHLHHHQPQHPPPQQQPQPQLEPPQHHHNPLVHLGGGHVSGQPAPLTQHNPLGAIGGATHSTAISHVGGVGVRMGLWAAERPPPPTHRSLTDLATGNPGHNLPHNPIRTTTPGISLYNGGLSTTALASTAGTVGGGGGGAVGATGGGGGGGAIGGGGGGDDDVVGGGGRGALPPEFQVTSPYATTTADEDESAAVTTTAEEAGAVANALGVTWTQDPGGVHYPGYVLPNDFRTLPRGHPRDYSPEPEEEEDEERLQALVSSVEAALRRIHAGLQESYIMYDNPDTEEDPPPPQPVTASLRDPPPSPVPPHEHPSSPPPPAGPEEEEEEEDLGSPSERLHIPGGLAGVGPPGMPRLVGPDNASLLSRQLGFIPIQEGAPQPPQPPPRHSEHHKHHHLHKLSKKVKNHKSKVLLSGLMTCPGPGFRLLNIKRDSKSGQGFGFSIKGGREAGIGVYVSRVEQGGPAWRAGLRPGDLLLAANNTNFSSVTHAEAIALLKSSEEVTLTVATTSQLPTSVVVAQTYSWVTPEGRPTSPPPEYNPRLHHHQVQRVEVEVVGSESLGLMIRGGVEYGLGIFITGVDPESAAHKAGLQIGDQILEVNGESFLAVTHDTAVNVLKYSRRLRLALRRVDKVPHSCTTYDRRCWPSAGQSNGNISAENMEATLAMIEEKSQRVLTRQHHERLREVVSDYAAGRIPIEHLLIIAREILDSPDKMSLLTELREVVRLEDQVKFDSAVFRHEPMPQEKTTEGYGGQVSNLDDFIEMYNQMELGRDDVDEEEEEEEEEEEVLRSDQRVAAEVSLGLREIAKTPSEDSGVEMSNGALLHRRDVARSLGDRKRTGILMRENGGSNEGVTWADAEIAENEYQLKRDREDRRSVGSKREKILQKRYSERILPKNEEVSHNIKPQRRHSLAPSSTRIRDEYDQSLPPPTGPSSASRGRDDYDPPPPSSRVRDDYESSPRGRGPSGIGGDDYAARLRDEYDPLQPPPSSRSLSEGYDPLSGDDFDVPSVRVHDDYHHLQGSAHDDYDVAPEEAYDMKTLGKGHADYGLSAGRDVYEGSPSRSHLTVEHRPGCGSVGGSSPCSSPVGGGSIGGSGGGGRRGSSEKQDELHPAYACRSRRTSLVVSDSLGRFRVVVKKTRPNLGIAIEGGADTKQRLPRVINIAANGAAFEAGGLRVGQLIIAVDGQKLDGHSHEEAARLIASCWVSRSRPEVEFMVVERKPTAADVRRSSISLLSQM